MDEVPQGAPSAASSAAPTPTLSTWHNVRILAFACFIAVPAVAFWVAVGTVIAIVASITGGEHTTCDIARIPVHGILESTGSSFGGLLGSGAIASADDFMANIATAENDPSIRGIVVDLDSPGGTPVAGDEMMQALIDAKKPTAVVIREVGASAAYWLAAGADEIIASPASDVGSIGVTMSYLETASSTDNTGARWIDLASGAHKDAGDPDRHLSADEQTFFKGQVDTVHDYMVQRIVSARPALADTLASLADGRAYVGTQAKSLGLVDTLGGFEEAVKYIASRVGLAPSKMTLCDASGAGLASLFK